MSLSMYWVVGIGLLYSATVAAIALERGRTAPARFVPWVIAIVVMSLDVAVHVVMSIGSMTEDPLAGGWVLVGTLALAGILVAAVWQPRLAGWAYVISALLMPLVVIVAASITVGGYDDLVPLPVLLGFYSTRAVVLGFLLVFSAMPKREESDTAALSAPVSHGAREIYDEAQSPGRALL